MQIHFVKLSTEKTALKSEDKRMRIFDHPFTLFFLSQVSAKCGNKLKRDN